MGILTKSVPCVRFTPDVFQMMESGGDEKPAVIRKFRVDGKKGISPLEFLGQLKRQDLQRFAAMAQAESASRRRGYHAGQRVYVQVSGNSSDPYLNCFVRAWVLHTTSDHVIVRGQDPAFNGFYTIGSDNVLTETKWKKLKKKMVKDGKINAPRSPKNLKIKGDGEDHEPPAINRLEATEVKNGSVTLRGKR